MTALETDVAPQDGETPAAPTPPAGPATWKLLSILGGGGAVAGLLIVAVYQATLPRIEANKAERLRAAVTEVLAGPARYDTLYLWKDALVAKLPPEADERKLDRVYVGYRADGARAGFAIVASEAGFADQVKVIFGYDAAAKRIVGFKVLEQKETPGLGDAIEKKQSFVSQFSGKEAPLVPVKPGQTKGQKAHEVDTITGATISSSTVVKVINHALGRWTPHLDAWREEGAR